MPFTHAQLERYSRNILLSEIGPRGQRKLLDAKVLVIGAGGLGAPAMMYLATAGVGTIGIADADIVDVSNLQRQIIHRIGGIGRPKVHSAEETIRAINPDVKIVCHYEYVTAENVTDLVSRYDFVIDATDNFPAKFLVNDACVIAGKPFCHAGVLRFSGQAMTWTPGSNAPHRPPCYRCVFREPPPEGAVPETAQAGVIGAIAGVIGAVEALEAIKCILGAGELLTGRMLVVNGLTMEARTITLPPARRDCPVCGERPTITKPFDSEGIWFPII